MHALNISARGNKDPVLAFTGRSEACFNTRIGFPSEKFVRGAK